MNVSDIMSNRFIKLVIAVFFFIFVYKILYNVGIFFGWNENILDMYMVWLGVFVVFIVILPIHKSML